MSDSNEQNELWKSKEEQHEFNKKFLIKLMIFMFFYRFYIIHIDPKETLINYTEKFLIDRAQQPIYQPTYQQAIKTNRPTMTNEPVLDELD